MVEFLVCGAAGVLARDVVRAAGPALVHLPDWETGLEDHLEER